MLDLERLDKEFTETLHKYSANDLQEWLDMDRKRIALSEIAKPHKLNGASMSTAKPRKLSVRQKKETVS